MKKNVAGQKIGAQLCSATTGAAFTGAVTVAVTGDAGTQATGSVGAGACTHEGSGYHTYAPAQAETNYDLIAFTFTGTGAIPATVQVLTSFPQTGDSYATITDGTVGLAAIEGLVDDLEGRLSAARAGYLDNLSAGAVALEATAQDIPTNAELATALAAADDAVLTAVATRASQASVDDLPTNAELATALGTADDAILAAIAALNNLSQANIRTAVGLASANLDTQLGDLPTNAELATALGTADDAILAAIAALKNLSAAGIRTAVGLASANLDTQIDALPTAAELTTALGTADDAVLTQVALVKTQTDKLTFTVANVVDANALRLVGDATAAANLARSALAIVRGAAAAGTLSTTQMTTDLTEATNDHYNGRVIIWTSGVLAGQATDITDYNGTTKVLTYTASTEAPSAADQFVIV